MTASGRWLDLWCSALSAFVCQHLGAVSLPPSSPPPAWGLPCPRCETCERLLNNDGHFWRRMFSTQPMMLLAFDRLRCFDHQRDGSGRDAGEYFDSILNGFVCPVNWNQGNTSLLWRVGDYEQFPQPAPAVLGLHESVDAFCKQRRSDSEDVDQAESCRRASVNVLSLERPRNMCRHFEWTMCAATGRLPGQKGLKLVFATAPNSLMGFASPFAGKCKGWRPDWRPADCADFGYASDPMFYLETCMLNKVCTNNRELWEIGAGEEFECEFSVDRWHELKEMLMREATSESGPVNIQQKCFTPIGAGCDGPTFEESCCAPEASKCQDGMCVELCPPPPPPSPSPPPPA